MTEKYFTPVLVLPEDDVKKKRSRQRQPLHQHQFYHQQQENHHDHSHQTGEHSHGVAGDGRRHGADNHEHHHQHHKPHTHRHGNQAASDSHLARANLSQPSSSSRSSTSSHSSLAWTSEPSIDDEPYKLDVHKPLHSLSCSNISDARCRYRDEESEGTGVIASETMFTPCHPQQRQQQQSKQSPSRTQQHLQASPRGPRFPKLQRGHSKSVEGLLQNSPASGGQAHHTEHGRLYKTASLGQSLGLGGDTGRPKKAVSSIQLPTKGILKNKDGGTAAEQTAGPFRKARSMEVLSTRVQASPMKREATLQAARENFVRGKVQFSAFLDEITRQVISPLRLSSLGVGQSSTPTASNTPQPTSPPEGQQPTDGTKQRNEDIPPPIKQRPGRTESQDSERGGTDSSSRSRSRRRSGKHRHNHRDVGRPSSSQPHRHDHHHHHHGDREKQPSGTDKQSATQNKRHYGKYSQLLTDGTSTSPEPVQPEHKWHHAKHQRSGGGSSRNLHPGPERQDSPPPVRATGLDSESPSSKSSTASHSSEKSDRHHHSGGRGHSKPYKDSVSSADRAKLLEEQNKDLHENLLQTVACIENLEMELQGTRGELGCVKDKFKKLQESNSILEQKLHSVTESMNTERKYLLHRILELTKELDTAQASITALESINVPSLIKQLLENHFESQGAVKHFLPSSTSLGKSTDDNQTDRPSDIGDNQSVSGMVNDTTSDWFEAGQQSSERKQQRFTAFFPWKQGQDHLAGPEQGDRVGGAVGSAPRDQEADRQGLPNSESGLSGFPFSVAEISKALYDQIPAQAKGPQPILKMHHFGSHTEIHCLDMSTQRCTDIPPNPFNLEEFGSSKNTGGDTREASMIMEHEANDVTSMQAQRILDNIMKQLPPAHPKDPGEEGDHRFKDRPSGPAEGR